MKKNIRAKKTVWGLVAIIAGVQFLILALAKPGVKPGDWWSTEAWWALDALKFVGLMSLWMGLIWYADGIKQEVREERLRDESREP